MLTTVPAAIARTVCSALVPCESAPRCACAPTPSSYTPSHSPKSQSLNAAGETGFVQPLPGKAVVAADAADGREIAATAQARNNATGRRATVAASCHSQGRLARGRWIAVNDGLSSACWRGDVPLPSKEEFCERPTSVVGAHGVHGDDVASALRHDRASVGQGIRIGVVPKSGEFVHLGSAA